MAKTYLTFEDLRDYIQTADRNSEGMHYPFDDNNDSGVIYTFHIYDGRRQVNICMTDHHRDSMPNSIGNFVFEDDEVSMFRVNNSGVADYDHPLIMSIATPIDHPLGSKEQNPDISRWVQHFGPYGSSIKDVLRDTILPVISNQ